MDDRKTLVYVGTVRFFHTRKRTRKQTPDFRGSTAKDTLPRELRTHYEGLLILQAR